MIAVHLPKNRRFYALLGGNLAVLAVVGLLVVRPVVGLLIDHTNQIVRTKAEVAALQQKTDQLRRLQVSYPAYEAAFAPVLAGMPKTRDVAGYQAELEALAGLTSTRLLLIDTATTPGGGTGTQVASGAPATVGGFPTIPVKVDIAGTYATILDFMHRLETMDRFTRVTGMDLKTADSSGAVKATLQLQTLYFGAAS